MNSFELNKFLGALLGCCLVLVAMHIASGAIFAPTVPAKPGYEIAVKAEAAGGRSAGGGAGGSRRSRPCWPALRSSTAPRSPSSAKPATISRKAQGAKVGPDLYGVVGPHDRLGSRASIIRRR